ncbi:MAG: hypothetical protein ACPGKZ_06875, partial [Flavobacteriaceae bacterium]
LLQNTSKEETKLIENYSNRIQNKWTEDLSWVDIDYNEFWIENRKYIQEDKFIKYNLYKRIDLWEYSIKEQLQNYKNSLNEGAQMLDSVIAVRDSEFELIWWVLNPKD